MFAARDELDRQLAQAHAQLGSSLPFRDFRHEAIKRIRARLSKERRPPTI